MKDHTVTDRLYLDGGKLYAESVLYDADGREVERHVSEVADLGSVPQIVFSQDSEPVVLVNEQEDGVQKLSVENPDEWVRQLADGEQPQYKTRYE